MKLKDKLKKLDKNSLNDKYMRIVGDNKNIDKMTVQKKIDEIIEVYNDYNNVIEMCTLGELECLKNVLINDGISDDRVCWEIDNLASKLLLVDDLKKFVIPEEIRKSVVDAIDKVDWDEVKEMSGVGAIAVGYMKMIGAMDEDNLIGVFKKLLTLKPKEVELYMNNNKLFHFYVIRTKDKAGNVLYCYRNYQNMVTSIYEISYERGVTETKLKPSDYECIFYNDFNINEEPVKKFYKILRRHPDVTRLKDDILYSVLMDDDRVLLKDKISKVISDEEREEFLKLLDNAMDEMSSGVLRGLTRLEYKEMYTYKSKVVKQSEESILSKREKKLFRKLYLGILEYTNKKFKVHPEIDYYESINYTVWHFSVQEYADIIDKFWENKERIIKEFCMYNPYKFDARELKIVKKMQKGFRDDCVFVEVLQDYCAVMHDGKCYMVKGVDYSLGDYVKDNSLPSILHISLIPFKDKIVYDDLYRCEDVLYGMEAQKILKKYEKCKKIYEWEE